MRLRGAPSLPDENLASSRARRSTAFAGSFTEPVRQSTDFAAFHSQVTANSDPDSSPRPTGITITPS
jgi:hypothetical protein